jgi:hypothetical protein
MGVPVPLRYKRRHQSLEAHCRRPLSLDDAPRVSQSIIIREALMRTRRNCARYLAVDQISRLVAPFDSLDTS